jgi:cytochrome c biogenesis protein CcdA
MTAATDRIIKPLRWSLARLLVAVLIGVSISLSWLVFPYFFQGKQVLHDVGESSRVIKAGSVSRYYTRNLVTHPNLELSATFATSEFFQYVDNANAVQNLRPDKYFIFIVSESIHTGKLSAQIPQVELSIGDQLLQPLKVDGPADVEHHRVSFFSFPKREGQGRAIDLDAASSIKLYVEGRWLGSDDPLTFIGTWDSPYELPAELKSSSGITPVAVLALGAGLLSSVLTPCLLQLAVVLASIVGGFATVPAQGNVAGVDLSRIVRRKIMQVAFAFVLGFMSLYVLAGAFVGALGHQAQLLLSDYSRHVAIVSGIVVVFMGIVVGLRGVPRFACKIAGAHRLQSLTLRDSLGAVVVAIGFALGCTACFGGAIVATLIVYVGVIGSASIGAGIMFIFSLGVAIPFMLAAFYASRMNSILVFLSEKTLLLSRMSMLLIIGFGVILITDNFHTVSDFIYPKLGLR